MKTYPQSEPAIASVVAARIVKQGVGANSLT